MGADQAHIPFAHIRNLCLGTGHEKFGFVLLLQHRLISVCQIASSQHETRVDASTIVGVKIHRNSQPHQPELDAAVINKQTVTKQ